MQNLQLFPAVPKPPFHTASHIRVGRWTRIVQGKSSCSKNLFQVSPTYPEALNKIPAYNMGNRFMFYLNVAFSFHVTIWTCNALFPSFWGTPIRSRIKMQCGRFEWGLHSMFTPMRMVTLLKCIQNKVSLELKRRVQR